MTRHFPKDFRWGVSTSSYQIEGGARDDGRGATIWDTYCDTPGKVANGENGRIACDHYHRWAEDLDLIKNMGAQHYRFSVMWPRVMPDGTGAVNEKGLAFYDRLVDGMLERGIDPWLCLYHWDLPQALQDRGGWANRDIVGWFGDYTDVIARRLGDRIKAWVTFNEPNVVAWVGHEEGRHAPGLTDPRAAMRVAHHLNLSHGRATRILKDICPDTPVGFVLPMHKAYTLPHRHEQDAHLIGLFEDKWNGVFLDPVYKGYYPDSVMERMEPHLREGDLEAIHQPVDFQGLNQYFPSYIEATEGRAWPFKHAEPPRYFRRTEMGWAIDGRCFYQTIKILQNRYGNPPIFITENGGAFLDLAHKDGQINDQDRIAYHSEYLTALLDAVEEGANVQGYMPWSLMDNFEWAYGYDKRFGLVHVDYKTQKRTPKASYDFMKHIMETNSLS
ncbi:GH1 family beta-glucosidase [Thalassospira sp.]|uniref:GH1 family beta-glucosidase n=1 Tax=Thalassospira sp. TaxID=1912094 RepID=UPI0027360970|nr:GH1 family beta-glucosidase [Thalassospira sp.]MDP2699319.1 GH1 family beta-glucosidase [Thalassospira sp.]